MKTLTFTGHRPEALGGYDYNSEKNRMIKEKLFFIIQDFIEFKDVSNFIVGGALGFDQLVCDVLLELKNSYKEINITVAIPFKSMGSNWPKKSQEYFKNQLSLVDNIVYVDELDEYKSKKTPIGEFDVQKMQVRNMYMVDNSDYLISCFNGSKGGTYNCIQYWNKKYLKDTIININPDNFITEKINKTLDFSEQIKDIKNQTISFLLQDIDYSEKKAKKFLVKGTGDYVWIPNSCLDEKGTIQNKDISFVFNNPKNNKILSKIKEL